MMTDGTLLISIKLCLIIISYTIPFINKLGKLEFYYY